MNILYIYYFTMLFIRINRYEDVKFIANRYNFRINSNKYYNVKSFGAKGDGKADDTEAVKSALSKAFKDKAIVYYPPGTYIQGPIRINGDKIVIIGYGKVIILRNRSRGWAFSGNINSSRIENITIDCDKSLIEGGIRISGRNNILLHVRVLNADAGSICISSRLNNLENPIATSNNLIKNCYVKGQKRYHEVGGLAPIIASDMAYNTIIKSSIVEDCVGNNIDYFDSDNAPNTLFDECTARKSGEMALATAFWSEGEQSKMNHKVTWRKCKVINFSTAFGSTEQVLPFLQNCYAKSCSRAYNNLNGLFTPVLNGLTAINCGKGLENSDIDAVIATTGAITMHNVITRMTIAKQSFVNYAKTFFTNKPILIKQGCFFDKIVRVSYGGTGSRNIYLADCQLKGTTLMYYNADSVYLEVQRVSFLSGSRIVGARIKEGSKIINCKFIGEKNFKGFPKSTTAVIQQLDNFNLKIERCYFESWQRPIDENTINIGRDNITKNCSNPVRPGYPNRN